MEQALTFGVQIATILTGITVFIMILQLRSDSKDQNLQCLFYLHEYLSKDEFSKARLLTRNELCHKGYTDWNASDKEVANKICASYDQAGLLVQEQVLDKRTTELFLKSSWGESVCDQFEILQPYLAEKQTPHKTGQAFFRHFVLLYERAKTYHRT